MIRKPRPSWKDREHLFTPANIVRYEQACCRDCIYRKVAMKLKVKALKNGPVIWIMKDGKLLDFTSFDSLEESMIEKEIENREGEPSEFWLDD